MELERVLWVCMWYVVHRHLSGPYLSLLYILTPPPKKIQYSVYIIIIIRKSEKVNTIVHEKCGIATTDYTILLHLLDAMIITNYYY